MGKTLTVAQKTFTDLYDSYVLNLSSDIVAVPCDQDGKTTEYCETTITYSASAGNLDVGASCTVDTTSVPEGVTCTTKTDGEIVIEIKQGTKLVDDSEMRFVFTTKNSKTFTFTRYITFIKVSKGENGENARSFQIRSDRGDTFDEGVDEITMTAVAFDGLTQIANVTYKWERYITGSGWTAVLDDGSYTGDGEATNFYTEASLTVNRLDAKDNPVFRCTVTYEDKTTDTDYYQLKVMHHNYESVVKFFGGTSDISSDEPFVVAYVDVYKDYQKDNAVDVDYYYYDKDNVKTEDGIDINFDGIDSEYNTDGNLVYAIYRDDTIPLDYVATPLYSITTTPSPANAGEVTGGGEYEYGSNITLTAAPNDGYIFYQWTDGIAENPRFETVTSHAHYAASFLAVEVDTYIITAKPNNPNYGFVEGLGQEGYGQYSAETFITLTAVPKVGYVFEDWEKDGVAQNWPRSVNVQIRENQNFIARFRKIESQNMGIISEIQPDDTQTISVYKNGMTYLVFQPDESGEYKFSAAENESIIMDGSLYDANMNLLKSNSGVSASSNFSITYAFAANQTYYFGINIANSYQSNSGNAQVHLQSTGVAGGYVVTVAMGTGGDAVTGAGFYEAGDSVTVSATALNGYEFDYWLGEDGSPSSADQTYSFTIQKDTSLTAVFKSTSSAGDEEMLHYITVSAKPLGAGTVTGGGLYTYGATAKITVEPNEGYTFYQWSDGITSTTRNITVTGDATYTATFHSASTISTFASPVDGGVVTGGTTVPYGSTVTLTATPNEGYRFVKWYDNSSTDPSRTVTAQGNATYVAIFEKIAPPSYYVADVIRNSDNDNDIACLSEVVTGDIVWDKNEFSVGEFVCHYAKAYDDRIITSVILVIDGYARELSLNTLREQGKLNSECTEFAEYFTVDETMLGTTRTYIISFAEDPDCEHELSVRTVAATCTTQGYTEYYCSKGCGYSYKDAIQDPLDHYRTGTRYENEVHQTCTQPGSYDIVVYCKDYNVELERTHRTISATGEHIDNDGDGYCDYGCGTQVGGSEQTLALNSTKTINVALSSVGNNKDDSISISEFTLVKFVAPSDGTYTFESTSAVLTEGDQTADPWARLYNSEMQMITKDDDGAGNRMFKIEQTLDAGTYYLAIKFYYANCAGTVDVKVTYNGSSGGGTTQQYLTANIYAVNAEGNDAAYLAKDVNGNERWTTTEFYEGNKIYYYASAGSGRVITKIEANSNGQTTEYGLEELESGGFLKASRTIFSYGFTVTSAMLGSNMSFTVYFGEASNDNTTYAEDTFVDGVLYIGTNSTTIASSAYYNHSISENIKRVVIPHGITYIGTQAFRDCSNIVSVDIPISITEIGYLAFFNCTSLTDVYYAGSELDWNNITISTMSSGNAPLTNATIHYNSTSTYSAEPAMMMMARSPMMTMAAADDGIATYALNTDNGKRARYKTALCQYSNSGWSIIEPEDNYVYRNDLYSDVFTKTIVVSKNDVSNYRSIDVTVYKKLLDSNNNIVFDNDLIVSNTSFTVFDINDPILSKDKPTSAKPGQLWLDTNASPYVLHIYQNGEWQYFNQQVGKTIYTEQPETYLEGDFWILSKPVGAYGEGTMLVSEETVTTPGGFHISHWTDATPDTTKVVYQFKENFECDDDGITIAKKKIGPSGEETTPFSVHIDSTRMGFYSQDDEVVHIGNNSAEIKNATFDGSEDTKFKNDASFYNQVNIVNQNSNGAITGFALQTEDNGSFSIILVNN